MSPRKGVGFALGPFGLRTWTGFCGGWGDSVVARRLAVTFESAFWLRLQNTLPQSAGQVQHGHTSFERGQPHDPSRLLVPDVARNGA